MWLILPLIFLMFVADVWWWWRANRVLRGRGITWPWRAALATWMLGMIGGLATVLVLRIQRQADHLPAVPVTVVYIWHFMVPVLFILPTAAWDAVQSVIRRLKKPQNATETAVTSRPSRRDFLATAVISAPPLVTLALAGRSIAQFDSFRVRRQVIRLAGLPAGLEGMTIAHVADTHIGSFTTPTKLRKIAEAVNGLRADVILQTGDLINSSLADLPAGIDFLRSLDAPAGVWSIEGNHDLIEDRHEFDDRMKKSGLPLLLNEAAEVKIRGTPLQLLGLRWGHVGALEPQSQARDRGDQAIAASMEELLSHRHDDAFSILLAHHPHAFDPAAAAGVPLTLSGHTHGGQIALTHGVGFGPLVYRYWSGLYERGGSSCFVSNGVGNWFPVRINVPAEIVHFTLVRA